MGTPGHCRLTWLMEDLIPLLQWKMGIVFFRLIVKELDRAGIPAVHIATITPISLSVGANRVVEGVSIPHPTGHVELTKEKEKQERAKQIHLALDALSENIQEQKVFEEGETL